MSERVSEHVDHLRVELSWLPPRSSPNAFLVHDGGEAALIDTGHACDESFARWAALINERTHLRIRFIVLTHHHLDHTGAAARLRAMTGARVLMHRAEEEALAEPHPENEAGEFTEAQIRGRATVRRWHDEAARTVVDAHLNDGDELRVGELTLRIVHTPGHTRGHVSVFLVEDELLFAGDAVLGEGNALVAPPEGDAAAHLASLRRLAQLPFRTIATGHGPIITEDARGHIRSLFDARVAREEQVLSLVRAGQGDLRTLVRLIYPELASALHPMAAGQLRAVLLKLEAEGRLVIGSRPT